MSFSKNDYLIKGEHFKCNCRHENNFGKCIAALIGCVCAFKCVFICRRERERETDRERERGKQSQCQIFWPPEIEWQISLLAKTLLQTTKLKEKWNIFCIESRTFAWVSQFSEPNLFLHYIAVILVGIWSNMCNWVFWLHLHQLECQQFVVGESGIFCSINFCCQF